MHQFGHGITVQERRLDLHQLKPLDTERSILHVGPRGHYYIIGLASGLQLMLASRTAELFLYKYQPIATKRGAWTLLLLHILSLPHHSHLAYTIGSSKF